MHGFLSARCYAPTHKNTVPPTYISFLSSQETNVGGTVLLSREFFLLLNHATDKINKWPHKQIHDRHRKHFCTRHFSAERRSLDKGQGLRVGGGDDVRTFSLMPSVET